MVLSDLQNKGKIAIKEWYDTLYKNKKYFVLGGIAGSGKSTIIKFIIDELGLDEEEVAMAAYTGMAANVLLKKGNNNSSTIHRLIYRTTVKEDEEGNKKYVTILKEKEELSNLKLIIIDECYMVPTKIINDLISFEIPIIFVGDPEQLPPVAGGDNGLELDFFLDEPHRQALDNPILYVANLARLKEIDKIRIGTYGDTVRVISREKFGETCFTESDQILAGKNKTVNSLNKFYRKEFLNYSNTKIEENEKIMCIFNNWGVENSEGLALVNGSIGHATNIKIRPKIDAYILDFIPDSYSSFDGIMVDKAKFENRDITRNTKIFRSPILRAGLTINEFVYSYVITTNKAQGSEFPYVTFIPEVLNYKTYYRFFYTGVTRATQKLDILL